MTQTAQQPLTDGQTILVVDDDVVAAKAMRSILAGAGYGATLCHAGAHAIDSARKTRPLAAVIDVHLPDVSGLVLTQQLRQILGPDVPIIVVSGDTSMETLNSLRHVGATWFFSKPMNGDLLLEHLKQRLQ